MKLKEYIEEIKKFTKEYLDTSKMDGFVLGLSGGVDSALVARLVQEAVGTDRLLCILMPCHSCDDDLHDALELCHKFSIHYKVIDLTKTFDVLKKEINDQHPVQGLSEHNIKVRLRMVTLYAIAQERKSLVLGTDNWDEHYIGYFTKYGDGACDLLPIVYLTKGEVYEASRMFGVTERILTKKPAAGLYANQTDEGEMGLSYADIDAFLLCKDVSNEAKNKIERMHQISEHKRKDIPRPQKFIR